MDEIIIKGKLKYTYLIVSTILLFYSIIILFEINNKYRMFIGLLGSLYFLFTLIVLIIHAMSNILIINKRGFIYRKTIMKSYGFISWSIVEQIDIKTINNESYLSVKIKENALEEFFKNKKKIIQNKFKKSLNQLNIPLDICKESPEEIMKFMHTYFYIYVLS